MPGFTADSYLAWQVATAIMLTVSVTAVGSGLGLVMDISSGYFDKLLLAPISRPAILLSRLMTEATRVTVQILIIVVIAVALGVRPEGGVLGVLLMMVMGILWAMAYAPISVTIALRTKNAEATNASFMLMFPLVYLTAAMMPKELYSRWLEVAASINPSHLHHGRREVAGDPWVRLAYYRLGIPGGLRCGFGHFDGGRPLFPAGSQVTGV